MATNILQTMCCVKLKTVRVSDDIVRRQGADTQFADEQFTNIISHKQGSLLRGRFDAKSLRRKVSLLTNQSANRTVRLKDSLPPRQSTNKTVCPPGCLPIGQWYQRSGTFKDKLTDEAPHIQLTNNLMVSVLLISRVELCATLEIVLYSNITVSFRAASLIAQPAYVTSTLGQH